MSSVAPLGATSPSSLRYVDHVIGGGADLFAAASRMGLEGMISKSRTEPYRPGACHRSWQKAKCQLRQEFVVGGWQPSVTGGLGAMIRGYYDDIPAVRALAPRLDVPGRGDLLYDASKILLGL
jgi:ATP-dependent DNA ligase